MRYSGSKKRFSKALVPILMEHIKEDTTFIDLFAGGMNIVCDIPHNNKWAVDLNKYVISLWQRIKDYKVYNVGNLDFIPSKLTEDEYHNIKQSYLNNERKYDDSVVGYVGNCCSFGGAWFNGYARYNPVKKENHIKEAYNGIMKQIKNFKSLDGTIFINCSYDELTIPPHSVIYCDPPYAGTKKYESDFDNIKFWDWVRMMTLKGHYVYVSEYSAPDDFKCIWEKDKKDGMGTTKCGCKQNTKVERLFVYDIADNWKRLPEDKSLFKLEEDVAIGIRQLLANQKDIDPEIASIVDKEFFNMI